LLVEVPIEEEPERAAFAFFAWRFSFSDLLAVVFELFEPPLSLLAMVAPSRWRDPGAERTTRGSNGENPVPGPDELVEQVLTKSVAEASPSSLSRTSSR